MNYCYRNLKREIKAGKRREELVVYRGSHQREF
jgi:hypothetical protein